MREKEREEEKGKVNEWKERILKHGIRKMAICLILPFLFSLSLKKKT